eukprot:TRINITY_DN32543_c0_g1_i1.p1 TRINITY_DN32543_c0_g1~~TRINITY_DN32543_c0_g1_i1.p1  ORF type:complete len:596 (+),score=240.73 TRINITY_DN32543_c0_g1_i1:122-1909(+)
MDITQTIVQEIVAQCGRHGFVVSNSLAHFYLMAQLLTEEKDSNMSIELPPDRIEALVDKSVKHLTQSDCPSLETFKLQASVTTMKQDQINKTRTEGVQHQAKSQQLMQEICTKTDAKQVAGDMTMYALHESHLFASTNDLVQKETMTALESVMPKASITPFIAQKFEDKHKQLEELWRIVWGIRLFNKKSQKGGAGIPNLPEDTEQLLQTSLATCRNHLQQAMKTAFHYQVVLSTPSIQLTDARRQLLMDEYINRKQFAVYLGNIQKLLVDRAQKFETLKTTWEELMDQLKSIVSQSVSIPKSAIYPRFIDLSDSWDAFREVWTDASNCKKILDLVVAYQAPYQPTLQQSDVEAALESQAPEPVPNRGNIAQEVANPQVNYLPDMEQSMPLEFNGFCIPSLIDKGLLLDGKKDEKAPGFIHLPVNNTYYAFSSERLLKAFAGDPYKYLSSTLLDTCAAQTELIHLLGMQNELPRDIYLHGTRTATKAKEVITTDQYCQTGHIPSYKDHNYQWNEWELRRLALKVADLRTKRTHHTQTVLSHTRRDNDTQTYLPKTQETQTAQSKATQPSKKVQYIKGLRGQPNQRVQVVKMEFDE